MQNKAQVIKIFLTGNFREIIKFNKFLLNTNKIDDLF